MSKTTNRMYLIKITRLPSIGHGWACAQVGGFSSIEELRANGDRIEAKLREKYPFVGKEACVFQEKDGICKGYMFEFYNK